MFLTFSFVFSKLFNKNTVLISHKDTLETLYNDLHLITHDVFKGTIIALRRS